MLFEVWKQKWEDIKYHDVYDSPENLNRQIACPSAKLISQFIG